MAAEIKLLNVCKDFISDGRSVRAVDTVDLTLERGQITCLLGPSGCGKTTLLRMIAGLAEPTSGEVRLTSEAGEATNDVGIVFQEANLFPWLNIRDNVALPLRIRGVDKNTRLKRADDLLNLVRIKDFGNHWPRQLSGGMRQRAAIARALAADPPVLLMDEPFGALDAMTRSGMNVELQRLWLELKNTIVVVTHSIHEAVFLGSRVVLLSPRPGKIEKIYDVPFARPRDLGIEKDPAFQAIVEDIRERLDRMG